jgi:flagellar biosynthetic protein FlhB
MAEEQDDSSKTEEATAKKLADAAERGEMPRSQEINHWFVLGSGTLALAIFASSGSRAMADWLAGFISNAHRVEIGPAGLLELMRSVGGEILIVLGLPFVLLIVGSIAGELIQHPPIFTTERMTPRLGKISPLAGAKRLFSLRAFVEFGKGLIKIGIASAAIAYVVVPEWNVIAALPSWDPADVLALSKALSLKVLMAGLAVLLVIAGLDYLYQRFSFMRDQRMTRQEVMDELKQQDGDPMVKARLRQIRMERARRRMMAAVPTADVVITNPTHYAVALKYDQGSMQAPKVVAKGVDAVAARIRELAKENDVPLVENPPLARALHAAVEVDQEILPEHYRAVAEIIGYVMKLKGRMAPGARPAPQGPRP